LNFGFVFFQHSNTPVLQNPSSSLLAKPLKLDLILRTSFSMIKHKLMLAFESSFLLEVHPTLSGEEG
jgi:hypothetical protein